MPAYNFVEVRKWIKDVASDHEIQISGRKIKALAGHWMIDQELEMDGEAEEFRGHKDPTGDEAVQRLLAMIYAAA